MVNGPFLFCALAFCTAVLIACWVLAILEGFFLSSCLVLVFLVGLDIVMAVVIVDKKKRETRETIADAIIAAIVDRVYYSKQF